MLRNIHFNKFDFPIAKSLRTIAALSAALVLMQSPSVAQCGWSDRFAQPGTGNGMNARVYDLTVFHPALYAPSQLIAGGDFSVAGGAAASTHVASFDGTNWTALGGTSGATNGSVFGLTTYTGTPFGIATPGS